MADIQYDFTQENTQPTTPTNPYPTRYDIKQLNTTIARKNTYLITAYLENNELYDTSEITIFMGLKFNQLKLKNFLEQRANRAKQIGIHYNLPKHINDYLKTLGLNQKDLETLYEDDTYIIRGHKQEDDTVNGQEFTQWNN